VQLTRQALQRGNAVTAFVRSPEKIKIQHERLRIVKGDPKNVEQLERALREQDAVLSALGSTSRQANGILEAAARSTIEAMSRAQVRRLVVVSMALLFPDVGLFGPVLRVFLGRHLRESAAMEGVVRASKLDWTIVRPPRLTNGTPTGQYRVSEQHVPPGFSICRADLAQAILDRRKEPFTQKGRRSFEVILMRQHCGCWPDGLLYIPPDITFPLPALGEASGQELSFKPPGLAVLFEYFTQPSKRIRRDLRKTPLSRSAVRSCADLHDLIPDLLTCLALFMPADGIKPANSPGLNCPVPDPQRCAVHVVHSIGIPSAIGRPRHDPNVLDCTSLENPLEVSFTPDLLL
jgi:putative NADH-flavin reductase